MTSWKENSVCPFDFVLLQRFLLLIRVFSRYREDWTFAIITIIILIGGGVSFISDEVVSHQSGLEEVTLANRTSCHIVWRLRNFLPVKHIRLNQQCVYVEPTSIRWIGVDSLLIVPSELMCSWSVFIIRPKSECTLYLYIWVYIPILLLILHNIQMLDAWFYWQCIFII